MLVNYFFTNAFLKFGNEPFKIFPKSALAKLTENILLKTIK